MPDLDEQLRAQHSINAYLRDRAEKSEAKIRAIERIHVWTNEDGKQFMFADDVRVALGLVVSVELDRVEVSDGR